MTFGQMIVLTLVTFLCVYTILDRVCKCLEICSTNRSYKKFLESINKRGVDNGTSRNPESNENGEKGENRNV